MRFDRFYAPGYAPWDKEKPELPVCEECGDECCVGLDETIYVKEDDIYFCSVSCLCKYDEQFTVQQLGGEWV